MTNKKDYTNKSILNIFKLITVMTIDLLDSQLDFFTAHYDYDFSTSSSSSLLPLSTLSRILKSLFHYDIITSSPSSSKKSFRVYYHDELDVTIFAVRLKCDIYGAMMRGNGMMKMRECEYRVYEYMETVRAKKSIKN